MRSILLTTILMVTMASCAPCRHLATSSKDSLRVEIRTRTEYLRDTVYCEIPAQSERVTTRDTVSRLENTYASSEARITSDGALFHSLSTKPQRVPVEFDRPIEHRDSIVYRDRADRVVVELPQPLTWWQQTQIRGFWMLLATIIIANTRALSRIIRRIIGV